MLDLSPLMVSLLSFVVRFRPEFRLAAADFDNSRNHYPHITLTERRATLPMSLVWVFICLATRLGFKAFPIGWPGTIIAGIEFPSGVQGNDGGAPRLELQYINLFENAPVVRTQGEWVTLYDRPTIPREAMLQVLRPANTRSMVERAINNIHNSFQLDGFFGRISVGEGRSSGIYWLRRHLVTFWAFLRTGNGPGMLRQQLLGQVCEYIKGPERPIYMDVVPIILDEILAKENATAMQILVEQLQTKMVEVAREACPNEGIMVEFAART